MSDLISHAERIRSVLPIENVVGQYVELKRAGTNLKGLCPFHNEKSPSFSVAPAKGIFYCFGCGAGGDIIKFVEKVERLEWVEALRLLSQQAGIPMPERTPGQRARSEENRSIREKLQGACEVAVVHFTGRLMHERARGESEIAQYLNRRQIDEQDIRDFGIGLSLDQWQDCIDALKKQGFSEETAIAAGLALPSDKTGRAYDRFRQRLIFPIHDANGHPVAFAGRVYHSSARSDEPKYVNSPETELYKKGNLLYAMHRARDGMTRSGQALLMEGYLDVIRAHRHGFHTAVATCGTALTEDQARTLKRFAREVVFCYDGDDAGQKAMLRGTEILVAQELRVRIVMLPDGHDPDSFLLAHGADAFRTYVDKAPSWLDYFLKAGIKKHGRQGHEAKVAVAEMIIPLVARIPSAIGRSEAARTVADALMLPADVIEQEVSHGASDVERREALRAAAAARTDKPREGLGERLDHGVLRLLVESSQARSVLLPMLLVESDLEMPASIHRWALVLHGAAESGSPVSWSTLMENAVSDGEHGLLSRLAVDPEPIDDSERALTQLLARLRARAAMVRARHASERIQERWLQEGDMGTDEGLPQELDKAARDVALHGKVLFKSFGGKRRG